jgi:hypothetical protein
VPLTWIEDSSSRSATIYRLGRKDASTRTRVFHVIGTANEDTLHAAANVAISTTYPFWTYPGQPLVKLRAESYSVEYEGDTAWKVTINYEKLGADDPTQTGPLKKTRSFDTTGGTQHVTQARGGVDGERIYDETGFRFGATAPTMKGAINVDDRGVQGVDIVVPQLTWTETYEVPSNYITSAYIRKVHLLTGSTNAAAFRGFNKGEVLFLGMTGSHDWDAVKGDGPWSLSYKFTASPNRGPDLGGLPAEAIGAITNYNKYGHEYMWIRYASADDQNNALVFRQPLAVYVNQVYPEGDFSKIGIGVA